MSSIRCKKPTGKDYGRRPYVANDYQSAMRRVPDKSMYDQALIKQSEFKKPYRRDIGSYEEMEYYYPDPFTLDYGPHTEFKGPVPSGTDSKWVDYGLATCFGDLCYCPGQHVCWPISCTYPIIGVSIDTDKIGVSYSQSQICFDADPDTVGFFWLKITLRLSKKHITYHTTTVSGCSKSECCGCEGISIGYTTQQMTVNEQQTLTALGAKDGCEYNWAVYSGGGSLSSNTGTSVVYTAPATNAQCANNPTIILSVGSTQCDSLRIAVDAVGAFSAYETPVTGTNAGLTQSSDPCPPNDCGCFVAWRKYYCNDNFWIQTNIDFGHAPCGCTGKYTTFCWEGEPCTPSCAAVWDTRTAAQKTAGCCPAALL